MQPVAEVQAGGLKTKTRPASPQDNPSQLGRGWLGTTQGLWLWVDWNLLPVVFLLCSLLNLFFFLPSAASPGIYRNQKPRLGPWLYLLYLRIGA